MSEKQNEKSNIKAYLLGKASSIDEDFEEKLMTDDEFFQEFQIQEEELIQDYVDEHLTNSEKTQFETHFLISKERQEKVNFAQSLRKHIDQKEDEVEIVKTESETPKSTNFFSSFFTSPIPVIACLLIIVGLSSVLIWNNFLTPSDNEIALASLNKAFKKERPLESRISEFDYAPKRNTRGNDDSKINKIELDRAEQIILKNASENPNAENLHALGRLYLTKKEFDNAIERLEKAETLNPQNVQIQNDLGVAYLEQSQLIDDKAEQLALNEKSLNSFDKAIEIKSNFLDAIFNKAITLQNVPLLNQAKKTWEEYLKFDSTSKWADEAKRNLQKLETNTTSELDAEILEKEFINAQDNNDEEKAFKLVSQNRELIREKYLPQRLAMSFLDTSEDKKTKYLEALKFLGEIEKKRFQDDFASDLAKYYENASTEKIDILKNAQKSMKQGYALLLKNDFKKGLESFSAARESFYLANNQYEANTISAIFIGYCLNSTKKKEEALDVFQEVNEFTKENNYVWLNSLNSYWLVGVETHLGKKNYLEAKVAIESNLKATREIDDLLLTQALLLSLSTKYSFVNQSNQTKAHLKELFQLSSLPNNSIRQKHRNYGKGTEMLVKMGLKSLSKAVVLEGLSVSEAMQDQVATLIPK